MDIPLVGSLKSLNIVSIGFGVEIRGIVDFHMVHP
jgi:hypothetical protein